MVIGSWMGWLSSSSMSSGLVLVVNIRVLFVPNIVSWLWLNGWVLLFMVLVLVSV